MMATTDYRQFNIDIDNCHLQFIYLLDIIQDGDVRLIVCPLHHYVVMTLNPRDRDGDLFN